VVTKLRASLDTHMLLQIIKTATGINFCLKRRHYRHISYMSVSEHEVQPRAF